MRLRNRRPRVLLVFGLVLLLTLTPLVYWISTHPRSAEASWWNQDWQYRKKIPITAHTAAETNEYIAITGYDASDTTKYQTDCGDVRFTKENGELLPYTVATCGATTTFNVLFDSFPAGAQDVYLYYGNANAENGFQSTSFSTEASNYTLGSLASEETTPGPIAYWKFDEGQGQTTSDQTTHKNNGTLGADSSSASDDPTWIEEGRCISGKCLSFDGSADHVAGPSTGILDTLTGSFTISTWLKADTVSGFDIVTSKWDGGTTNQKTLELHLNEGIPALFVSSDGATNTANRVSSKTLSANTWYHITAVYDASSQAINLYTNGVLTNGTLTGTVPTSIFNSSAAVLIGADKVSGTLGSFFDGFIDEPKIYPYARSAAQIKADFDQYGTQIGSNQKFLSEGLVGYWKLDESATPAIDTSGNSSSGTWNGNTAATTGKFGNGISNDATNDYISTSKTLANLNISNQITVSTWINLTSNPSQTGGLFSTASGTGDAIALLIDTSGQIFVYGLSTNYTSWGTAFATTSSALTTSTWTHVTYTYDSVLGGRLYINGVPTGNNYSVTNGGSLAAGGSSITLGSWISSGTGYGFTGKQDETRIYNRALTPSEVEGLYSWAPGPIGHWNFDEGTGTSAADDSGNANTGTITDPSWVNGKISKALSFNGTSTEVNIGDTDNTSGMLTVSAWIKPNTISGGWDAIYGETSFGFYNKDGVLTLWTPTFSAGTGTLTLNQWQHVAATFDSSTDSIYFYINGVNVYSKTNWTGTVLNDANTEFIGSYNGSQEWFSGHIDDARIYNYARTPGQIVEDMNAGHPTGGSPVGSQLAYWAFDDQQGQTTQDRSTNNLDTTLGADSSASSDDPTWKTKTDCKINGCLSFDGSADYTFAADSSALDTTGSFTITTWIKNDTLSGFDIIASKWDGGTSNQKSYEFHINETVPALFISSDGSSNTTNRVSSTALSTATWYHLAAVYDASAQTISLYTNGKLSNGTLTGTVPSSVYNSTSSVIVGADKVSGTLGSFYDGLIDEVKIYNSALTADQIALDMNAGSAVNFGTTASSEQADLTDGADDPPVLEMKLDEKTGTTANSTSGTFTGTLTTGPTWTQGKSGAAVNFDGSDDFIDIGTGPTSVKTVEFWVYPATTTEYPLDLNGTAYVWASSGTITATGFTSPTIYVNGISGATTIAANTWSHVAVTTATGLNASDLDIGRIEGVGNHEGKIDQVVLYDYVRTQSQITYDYSRGKPIGQWRLDECQGTVANDSSGSNYNGTITIGALGGEDTLGTCQTSSTSWGSGASGKYSGSLDFDGTDDYVSIADNSVLSGGTGKTMTIAAWVNADAFGATRNHDPVVFKYFDSSNKDWGLGVGGGYVYYGTESAGNNFNNTGVRGTTTLSTGTWYHVAFTQDSRDIKIYLNGKIEGSTTLSFDTPDTAATADIGRNASNSFFFNGRIDDVKIYNYALSAAEIKKVMNESSSVRFGP